MQKRVQNEFMLDLVNAITKEDEERVHRILLEMITVGVHPSFAHNMIIAALNFVEKHKG